MLFDYGASHSFIGVLVVIELGLEVEALEEPLYVISPLGIRARIGMICRGCELKILGIILTVDLRVMDMSEFDVILGMDWLTAYRVVIDCEPRGLPPTNRTVLVLYFRGISMIFYPDIVRVQVSGTVGRLASKPYPKGRGETGLRSTSSSMRVRGCFSR